MLLLELTKTAVDVSKTRLAPCCSGCPMLSNTLGKHCCKLLRIASKEGNDVSEILFSFKIIIFYCKYNFLVAHNKEFWVTKIDR